MKSEQTSTVSILNLSDTNTQICETNTRHNKFRYRQWVYKNWVNVSICYIQPGLFKVSKNDSEFALQKPHHHSCFPIVIYYFFFTQHIFLCSFCKLLSVQSHVMLSNRVICCELYKMCSPLTIGTPERRQLLSLTLEIVNGVSVMLMYFYYL